MRRLECHGTEQEHWGPLSGPQEDVSDRVEMELEGHSSKATEEG